jgi:hypothetical protein
LFFDVTGRDQGVFSVMPNDTQQNNADFSELISNSSKAAGGSRYDAAGNC